MSANPPKNDRWPAWSDIRFVLVPTVGKLRPCRGLIIDWRAGDRSPEALVVYFDDAGLRPVHKMEWFAKPVLIPVPVDPNWRPGESREGSPLTQSAAARALGSSTDPVVRAPRL